MIGAVAVSLLAVGGVAAVAGQKLFNSGTSQDGQPAAVLPVDSIGYYRVDFDPSTAQKVAAFRLFDKLPDAKKALGDGNPKKALFDLIKKDGKTFKDVDYANDIEPWLGDRIGLAILAPRDGGKDPVVVAAVQVKDEAKAKEGIEKLKQKATTDFTKLTDSARANTGTGGFPILPGSSENRGYAEYTSSPSATLSPEGFPSSDSTSGTTDSSTGSSTSDSSDTSTSGTSGGAGDKDTSYWYRDGYMLLTPKADEQAVRAAVDKGRLVDNQDFTKDMGDLGEQGVLSGWTDTPKFVEAMTKGQNLPASSRSLLELAGRQAGAVRFDAGYVEMASLTRDKGLNINHPAMRDIAKLPADTVGFMSGTGGADLVKVLWPRIESLAKESNANWDQQLQQFQSQTGIALPGDLETLLGKQFDLVVSEKSVKDKLPVLGLRLLTDTPKAEGVLDNVDKLLKQAMSGNRAGDTFGLHRKTEGDFIYVGSTASYRDELAGGGNLGDDATMKEALPNLDKANGAFYVNLDKIERLWLGEMRDGQEKDLLSSLKAFGMTSVKNGDRYDSTTRVLVN